MRDRVRGYWKRYWVKELRYERRSEIRSNKETVVKRFDQLSELRNGIRHSRTVDEVTRKEGEAAVVWFRQVLGA